MSVNKCFIDTNILLYAHTDQSPEKQQIAQSLIAASETIISTQVVQEMANTLYRKFGFDWKDIHIVLNEVITNNGVHTNTEQTILAACNISDASGFSFYDSLIVASAMESGCAVLYSEDMQHQRAVSNSLTIINPFI